MEPIFKYRNFSVTAEDVAVIKGIVGEYPDESRRALSRRVCLQFGWVQPNGFLRDMICRSFLLELERAGHITLPPKRFPTPNPLSRHRPMPVIEVDQAPYSGSLAETNLTITQVRRTARERECNSLIARFHYLGYTQPVGEHLKYMVLAQDRPIACFTWSSAPRHIGVRDRFIGWNQTQRMANLSLMAYNSRFLILPWVRIPHLASHLLGRIAKRIAADWHALYRHPVYYLETFVDTERFRGTCYRSANWIYLGDTTGQGKNNQTKRITRSIKAVYGYPLAKNFRERLCRPPVSLN